MRGRVWPALILASVIARPLLAEVPKLPQFSLFRDQLHVKPAYSSEDKAVKVVIDGELLWPIAVLSAEPPTGDPFICHDHPCKVVDMEVARSTYVGLSPDISRTLKANGSGFESATLELDVSWNGRDVVEEEVTGLRATRPDGHTIAALTLELQRRSGDFPADDQGTTTRQVDQVIGGVRLLYQPSFGGKSPLQLTANYFKVDDDSPEPSTLPDGITADRVQVRAQLEYYFSAYLGVQGDLRLTHPTSGNADDEYYAELALLLRLTEGWKVAARYRTGENMGFDYDKDVLVGLLLKLAG